MTGGPIGPILLLTTLCLVGGAVLFVLGFRGRRLNDHPVCRKCRFDLFGLPNDAARCPECGRDITTRRSTRVGVRKRRPVMLTLGVLLLVVGLGLGGVFTWSRARNVDWNPYKPTWLLLWETGTSNAARLDGVINELHARWSRGELSDGAVRTLIADGLARQGDPNAAWPVQWSNLIEDAILQGKVSKEDTLLYFQQAVKATIDWRQRLYSGTSWPVRVSMSEDRAGDGSSSQSQLWLRRQIKTLRVGDVDLASTMRGSISGGTFSRGGRSASSIAMPLSLPDGTYEVDARWTLSIVLRGNDLASAPVIAEWEVHQTGLLEIVPPDVPLIALSTNDRDRQIMSSSIERIRLRLITSPSGRTGLSGTLEMRPCPVAIAADVVARIGDREWVLGRIAHTGVTSHQFLLGQANRLTDFPDDATHVTIILRPSIEAAMTDPVINTIWAEPIDVPTVEIERIRTRDPGEGG